MELKAASDFICAASGVGAGYTHLPLSRQLYHIYMCVCAHIHGDAGETDREIDTHRDTHTDVHSSHSTDQETKAERSGTSLKAHSAKWQSSGLRSRTVPLFSSECCLDQE